MQVNENGVISFENPWKYYLPKQFPTSNFAIKNALALAPFWSDNDIRKEGAVRYTTYNPTTDKYTNGGSLLKLVNDNIHALQGETSFAGSWMLIAHWDGVHPSPHGDNHRGIFEEELDKVS